MPAAPLAAPAAARPWLRQAGRTAAALALVVAGVWTATHGVAGVALSGVVTVLTGLPVGALALLAVVWSVGLAIYATVLAAALPGLGVRRGLLLNLSGSAVANLMPLGGAVATGLNWRMVRSWGHSNRAFGSFCALTNVLDVATKLVLPVVAVAGLALLPGLPRSVPTVMWAVAGACLLVLLGGFAGHGLLVRPGRAGGDPHGSRWPTSNRVRADALLHQVRTTWADARTVLSRRWRRLLPGSIGYVAAQVLLLDLSLRAVGVAPALAVVVMAAAIERLTSLVPITPGGAGFAELGTIAWLVATGLDPTEVVAGVLLYRVFLVALEIPVGGALLGGWVWRRRVWRRRALRRRTLRAGPVGG